MRQSFHTAGCATAMRAVSHRKLRPGDPDRNLHIYQQKLRRGESFSPREQYYYARELCDHGAYRAALPVLERFLEEGSGWGAGLHRSVSALRRLLPPAGASGHCPGTAVPVISLRHSPAGGVL